MKHLIAPLVILSGLVAIVALGLYAAPPSGRPIDAHPKPVHSTVAPIALTDINEWNTYTNRYHNFTFRYPVGWMVASDTPEYATFRTANLQELVRNHQVDTYDSWSANNLSIIIYRNVKSIPQFGVVPESVTWVTTLNQFFQYSESQREAGEYFDFTNIGTDDIAGRKAYLVDFIGDDGVGHGIMQEQDNGNILMLLRGNTTTTEEWNAVLSTFRRIRQ